jgi:tetratricopeptide (TPR) repeat protein
MKTTLTLFFIVLFQSAGIGQHAGKASGQELLQQKKFAEAEAVFNEDVSKNPDNPRNWFFLATSQISQKKYTEAIENFKKANQFDIEPKTFRNGSYFQIAKSYAALNDKANSLKYLNTIADNAGGRIFVNRLNNDKDFDLLKNDPALTPIKEKMEKNTSPCLYDQNSKKLDFFIGTWDVFVQNSDKQYVIKVGEDSVVRSEGGCSLLEYFIYFQAKGSGLPDFKGKSMSFFDPARQKFIHCWAGSAGDIYNYEAIDEGENTITFLAIANSQADGLMHRKFKFTFHSEDGSLHQLIENSYDLGKTWRVDWDAKFIKKK